MKKITHFFICTCSIIIFLLSCRKEIVSNTQEAKPTIQTTTSDLKPDTTSVPLSLASQLAQKFLQSKNPRTTVTIKNAETITKNGIPYIHIINASNNAGFVMISADSMYAPILAFDSIGNFDKSNLNAGLALWFNKQGKNIDYIRTHKNLYRDSIVLSNKTMWLVLGKKYKLTSSQKVPASILRTSDFDLNPTTTITYDSYSQSAGPLCSTQWEQGTPYNEYCPSGSVGHMPAGCVPIAMAQVMYFWQHPTTYNWSNMPLSLATTPYSSNMSGYDECATLIHDIGTRSVTDIFGISSQFVSYGDNGSSANDFYCPQVFNQYYYSASRTETISDQILWGAQNGTAYSGLLINELIYSQRPCMVGGSTDESTILGLVYWPSGDAHEWVCDGCNQTVFITTYTTTYDPIDAGIYPPYIVQVYSEYGYLHMNWGFGPYALGGTNNDGWYDYSIDYTNAPGSSEDFEYFQTVIYNIHP